MKQINDQALLKAMPYMYKILQFCPTNTPFNLLHILNISDLPGTMVTQGLKMLKEVHHLLVEHSNYATCIQQEFPKPTWYTLTEEGRSVQQETLNNPLPSSLDMFVEVHASNSNLDTTNKTGLN